eukprot:scaffold24586_cov111-Isochrysis_galbana.AAC.1
MFELRGLSAFGSSSKKKTSASFNFNDARFNGAPQWQWSYHVRPIYYLTKHICIRWVADCTLCPSSRTPHRSAAARARRGLPSAGVRDRRGRGLDRAHLEPYMSRATGVDCHYNNYASLTGRRRSYLRRKKCKSK